MDKESRNDAFGECSVEFGVLNAGPDSAQNGTVHFHSNRALRIVRARVTVQIQSRTGRVLL